jgi:hypothetical protein
MACKFSNIAIYLSYLVIVLTQSLHSFVPHDQASLLDLYGGPDSFVDRLSYMHDQQIT